MKVLLLACLSFIGLFSLTVAAETKFDLELAKVSKQREKAIADAIEPINKKCQAALEGLLKRATQANDLESALKIKRELDLLTSKVVLFVLDGSEWTWERPGVSEWVKFHKDGTVEHQHFSGKWEALDRHQVKLSFHGGEVVLEFSADGGSFKAITGEVGVTGRKK